MFIRKKQNRSGTTSVVLIDKSTGKYKVLKTFGSSSDPQEVEKLYYQAEKYQKELTNQQTLFKSTTDSVIEEFMSTMQNAQVRTLGPELVFGKIFDMIGYGVIKDELFRHLVISRLSYPGSKLKTIDYLYRYQGKHLPINSVYKFLDKLSDKLKDQIEQISFNHTEKRLGGQISVMFYDMTTLYFEASGEDDLRKTGFSKDGKHRHPQIFLGLLVGLEGLPIGYDIFEGNIYEGHTLIPTIQKYEKKFNLNKPLIVADSGLLSKNNIELLEEHTYQYILGARIKSEKQEIKNQISAMNLVDGQYSVLEKGKDQKLIICYSKKRADKDKHNRKRGLMRLEKQIRSGKLTKANINNRGYNKYLQMEGSIKVSINYDRFAADEKWDGLKGFITNSDMSPKIIIENYRYLWHIERAFRISKTDLKIRPIFHRLRNRIEAHICISFVAYSIIKEIERILKLEGSKISTKRTAELTDTMYQTEVVLPDSKKVKTFLLKMDNEQNELIKIINKYS